MYLRGYRWQFYEKGSDCSLKPMIVLFQFNFATALLCCMVYTTSCTKRKVNILVFYQFTVKDVLDFLHSQYLLGKSVEFGSFVAIPHNFHVPQ